DGTFNPLYPFANNGDGDHPWLSGLVELSDGTFFGTTSTGGDYHNGVIFNVDPFGFLFPMYSFSSSAGDGATPASGLVRAPDGNYYGTTENGGQSQFGTVFRIAEDGTYTTLFSFNGANGATPMGRLAAVQNGTLYGTTLNGGASFHGRDGSGNATGYGTVF